MACGRVWFSKAGMARLGMVLQGRVRQVALGGATWR